VAKELVELHGGKIGVISEERRGSTFIVSLPINAATPIETESDTLEYNIELGG